MVALRPATGVLCPVGHWQTRQVLKIDDGASNRSRPKSCAVDGLGSFFQPI